MIFPCEQPVTWIPWEADHVNEIGDDEPGWGAARQLLVFAWHVGKSAESNLTPNTSRVDSDATVHVPASAGVKQRDRIELPGHGLFEVDGIPANFDANPWWSPGLSTVNLRQVTGP